MPKPRTNRAPGAPRAAGGPRPARATSAARTGRAGRAARAGRVGQAARAARAGRVGQAARAGREAQATEAARAGQTVQAGRAKRDTPAQPAAQAGRPGRPGPRAPGPGPRELDLVETGSREHYEDAALYDYEYRRRRADVSFYREIARRRLGGPGRILELGCGSGRVTVPLARDGHQVIAVDRSPQMLDRLRARVAGLPAAAAARITPVEADLRSFDIPDRGAGFPLAIAAFNVLEHLYTRGEVDACLRRVAAHLAPGGAFVFDVQLPDLAWLIRDPGKRWARTRFTDPTTKRPMLYSTNHDYDPISQIALIRIYYDPVDEVGPARRALGGGGGPGGAGRSPLGGGPGSGAAGVDGGRVVQLSQRKFFPAELEALVSHAGMRVVERFGDFSFGPLGAGAESQVLVCEPAAARRETGR